MINFNKKDAVADTIKSILKQEEVDVNKRTQDTLAGPKKTKQKDDVGPGSNAKSSKIEVKSESVEQIDEKNWIAGAIKKPGAMTAAAKRAGESTSEYEQKHKHDSGKAGKRARLAITLKKFKEENEGHSMIDQMINEVLSKDASAGAWIHDFVHSDNPKFAGKSKAKRKEMALAAYYAKQKNEEVESVEEALKGNQEKIDKNHNGKIDAQDFKILHNKKKANEEVEVEYVYEANIQPTAAKSRSHISNLSNPTVNSVTHKQKQIGLITKQSDGTYHAHPSSVKLSHHTSGTFDTKDQAHQFIRNAHAKAIKTGTLSDKWKKQTNEEVESVEEASDAYKDAMAAHRAAATDHKLDVARAKMQKRADEPKSALSHATKTFIKHAKDPLCLKKEEVEQIDELSKSTLGSYVKSAARDASASRKLGADFQTAAAKAKKDRTKASNTRLADKFNSIAQKRHTGIGKAVERLTKEETVEEGWDDMVKSAQEKVKSGPKPSGGSGVKLGTRYGGGKQKEEPKEKEEVKEGKQPLDNVPFDPPYNTTSSPDVKDKSGAVHTPMSRVKHIARTAMKKVKKELGNK